VGRVEEEREGCQNWEEVKEVGEVKEVKEKR
jgi:hypothetical protein